MEAPTHAEISIDGRKHTKESDKLLHDARENVGAPTSQRRQRRSPYQYTGYMALLSELVEIEPSSFEEVVKKLVWFDYMVEEYDSMLINSFWEVFPRPENTSVVSSKWIYKVKQATYGSIKKDNAIFSAMGFSQVEGIDYEETLDQVARYSSIK